MADMRNAFPSKYIRASDLRGQDMTLAIQLITMERMQNGDECPVVYFQGAKKGFVLNKTNTNSIIGQLGAESDNWTGQAVTLFPTHTEYQGEMVEAIRIRPVGAMQTSQAPAIAPGPDPSTPTDIPAGFDDENPF